MLIKLCGYKMSGVCAQENSYSQVSAICVHILLVDKYICSSMFVNIRKQLSLCSS